MAGKDSTALNNEQLKTALETIAQLAIAIDNLYARLGDDDNGALRDTVRPLVSQMGLIADRCSGFSICGFDSWMLPPSFKHDALIEGEHHG
ncbi:MAG: hypothetical protein Q7S69_07000 [Nitrosomonadaceae bacterium]|nr:hypothetical protein [Nitrosomonadaceae bacterium]